MRAKSNSPSPVQRQLQAGARKTKFLQMKGTTKMKSKYLILAAIVALAGFLPQSEAGLFLGSADSFAVLGGSTVTSIGDTVLNGNLGVYPGTAITGFGPPGTVHGTTYAGGEIAQQAQSDAIAAYTSLAGLTPKQDLTGKVLGDGGVINILTPGVYHFNDVAQLTGTLTLSGTGEFDFQIGTTLTTAVGSSIVLSGGAQAGNVFWQVGSSATLDTGTVFFGSILAHDSITLDTRTSMDGRALALGGAVTLDGNTITAVPEPGALWPLVICASILGAGQRLAGWRRKARGLLRAG
jgi:hypothetical protein